MTTNYTKEFGKLEEFATDIINAWLNNPNRYNNSNDPIDWMIKNNTTVLFG
jgi:hypothetical protein